MSKRLQTFLVISVAIALALGAVVVLRPAPTPIVFSAQGVTNFDTVQVEDGSAGAPSHSFTTDPDSGLYLSAAGVMEIAIAGASVGSFDSTGFVGAAGSVFDCNGVADCFVLDTDGDSTLSGPTDDQADLELGGNDEYVFSVGILDIATNTLNRIDLDADNDTSLRSSTDDQVELEVGAADEYIFTAAILDIGNNTQARIDFDSDNDTSLRSSADDVFTFELGGTDSLTLSDTGATGSGGDIWDYTDTLNIANGSDDWKFLDLNVTGANATGTANTIQALDLSLTTPDAQVIETAIVVNANWDIAADFGEVPVYSVAAEYFDDFVGDTIRAEGIYASGADATDPALNQQQYGAVRLVAGATDSGFADDFSGIVYGLHWSADQGGLILAARVTFITDIDDFAFCIGLNDTLTDEMFALIGTDGTPDTLNSGDGVAFCVDDTMTTNNWSFVSSNSGAEATGTGQSSVLPVAGAFDDLRIEVSADGAEARYYINGALVGTTTGGSVTAASLLTPFIVIDDDGGNSQTVDIDYIFVSAKRD